MRKIAVLAAALFCLTALSLPASAAMEDELGVESVSEALPDSAREILGETDVMDTDAQTGLERLLDAAMQRMGGAVREVLRPITGLMAAVLLCSCAQSLTSERKGFDYINLAGCLAVAAIALGEVNSLLAMGRSVMAELTDFANALLPALCAAAAAAGAFTSAPAKYAATALFSDVLINTANTLVLPLVCAYLAAALADAALGDGTLTGAVKLLKWACGFVMAALMTAFTLYLSISGVVAASADELTTKAAKTAISAALPVVGGIVSDAAGSIVAGAGIIRGAVGVFGLIAVLAVCLTPFLKLGVRYVLFKACAALASPVCSGSMAKLIDAVGTACGMILGLVGSQALMLYISVISMLKAVGA